MNLNKILYNYCSENRALRYIGLIYLCNKSIYLFNPTAQDASFNDNLLQVDVNERRFRVKIGPKEVSKFSILSIQVTLF